jgi:hypothetical protein
MWASILSILAYLAPFMLEAWQASRPEAKKEALNEETQKLRLAIYKGNPVAVNNALNGLLSDGNLPTKTGSDSATGQHSDADTAQCIGDILGSKVVLR